MVTAALELLPDIIDAASVVAAAHGEQDLQYRACSNLLITGNSLFVVINGQSSKPHTQSSKAPLFSYLVEGTFDDNLQLVDYKTYRLSREGPGLTKDEVGLVSHIGALDAAYSTIVYTVDGRLGLLDRQSGISRVGTTLHVVDITSLSVNIATSQVLTGGGDGHVHITTFAESSLHPSLPLSSAPLISKNVGNPLTSGKWRPVSPHTPENRPTAVSWTTSKGHFQVMDLPTKAITVNIVGCGPQKTLSSHDYLRGCNDVVLGFEDGSMEIVDVSAHSAWCTVRDSTVTKVTHVTAFNLSGSEPSDGQHQWAVQGVNGVSIWSVKLNTPQVTFTMPQQTALYRGDALDYSQPLLVLPVQHSRNGFPALCAMTTTGKIVALAVTVSPAEPQADDKAVAQVEDQGVAEAKG